MKGTPLQALEVVNAALRCGYCYSIDVIVVGIESTTMGSRRPDCDPNRKTIDLVCDLCGSRWSRTFYPHGGMADSAIQDALSAQQRADLLMRLMAEARSRQVADARPVLAPPPIPVPTVERPEG